MCKKLIVAITVALCGSLFTLPASADTIANVTAAPSQVNVNQTVTITVEKSGFGNCTAVVEYDDGQQSPPFQLTSLGETLNHFYASPGTYTILARGDAGGLTPACLTNGPQTADVTVVSGRPTASPAPDVTIKPLPPRPSRAPDTRIVEGPNIKTHVFYPAKNNGVSIWAAPDILAPGGRLVLGGGGFGVNPGEIRIFNSSGASEPLEIVFWSGTQVHGIIPSVLGGGPRQRFDMEVKVFNAVQNRWSPPYPLQYENAFAFRVLTMNDPAVSVLECDPSADGGICNDEDVTGTCYMVLQKPKQPFMRAAPEPAPTIYGTHLQCGILYVGNDEGTDRYAINLDNGWTIHRLVDHEIQISSGDESVFISPTPTGVSTAEIEVDWSVSPGDNLRYWLIIEAVGPIGTQPF